MKPLAQFVAPSTGTACRIGQHAIGRQLLRLVAQSIHHPRAERGSPDDAGDAAVKIADRNFVAVVAGMHRADDADVVDDAGDVGQQFGDFGTALTMFFELEGTGQQLSAGRVGEAECDVALVRLAVVLGELGLGIQQVDVRRAAVHEERDHRLGLWRKVGRLGPQVERRRIVRLGRRLGQQFLFGQQPSQGHAADAECLVGQKLAARLRGRRTISAAQAGSGTRRRRFVAAWEPPARSIVFVAGSRVLCMSRLLIITFTAEDAEARRG